VHWPLLSLVLWMGHPLSWGISQHTLFLRVVEGVPTDPGPSSVGLHALLQLLPKFPQWNHGSGTQYDPYHHQSKYKMGPGMLCFSFLSPLLSFLVPLLFVWLLIFSFEAHFRDFRLARVLVCTICLILFLFLTFPLVFILL
jgi:hypothetical protein